MHVLSKKVVRELDGTYALELDRFHGESAEAALDFVNKELCRMHKPKACNFGRTRKDLRWALGVVRRSVCNAPLLHPSSLPTSTKNCAQQVVMMWVLRVCV